MEAERREFKFKENLKFLLALLLTELSNMNDNNDSQCISRSALHFSSGFNVIIIKYKETCGKRWRLKRYIDAKCRQGHPPIPRAKYIQSTQVKFLLTSDEIGVKGREGCMETLKRNILKQFLFQNRNLIFSEVVVGGLLIYEIKTQNTIVILNFLFLKKIINWIFFCIIRDISSSIIITQLPQSSEGYL